MLGIPCFGLSTHRRAACNPGYKNCNERTVCRFQTIPVEMEAWAVTLSQILTLVTRKLAQAVPVMMLKTVVMQITVSTNQIPFPATLLETNL